MMEWSDGLDWMIGIVYKDSFLMVSIGFSINSKEEEGLLGEEEEEDDEDEESERSIES
jgi:hypothetical protein